MVETPAVEAPTGEGTVVTVITNPASPNTTTTVTITEGKKGGGSMGLVIIALMGGAFYRLRRKKYIR